MRQLNPHSPRRVHAHEKQMAVLRTLAESAEPLKSAELASHCGLFPDELRAACRWLQTSGYITSTMKREKVQVGHSVVMKPLAYWSLTDKGRAHLEVAPR